MDYAVVRNIMARLEAHYQVHSTLTFENDPWLYTQLQRLCAWLLADETEADCSA